MNRVMDLHNRRLMCATPIVLHPWGADAMASSPRMTNSSNGTKARFQANESPILGVIR